MAARTYKPTVKPGPGTYVQQPVTSPSKSPTIIRWGQPNPGMAKAPPAKPASNGATTSTAPYAPPPVSPSGSVLPPDPTYDQTIGALTRQRDASVSGLQSQRAAQLLGYGFNEDASGGLTFDPNNAFSKAAQYKKRFDESRQRTGNSMASRGQLYAGAYQQGQDILNRGQLQGEDALQKQLLAYLAGNTGQQAQARTNYLTGEAQAGADRLGRIATNPLYNPGAVDAAPLAAPVAAPVAAPSVYRGPIYTNFAKPGNIGGKPKK